MTEEERVTVNNPRGPVNNGPGAQHNYYGIGPDWMIRKGVEPLRIAHEDRMRLADRFVRPENYRTAAERLEKPGSAVLLDGRPGSGRRAAAVMLLHELGEEGQSDQDDARFEELAPTVSSQDGPLAPGEGDRFLVDLSGVTDEAEYLSAQRDLTVRLSAVRYAGAHIVVVLPSAKEHLHAPDLEPHTVSIGRPRGIAVVTRHLRMDRMAFRTTDLENARLRDLCERSPMRELARLTALVRGARDSGRFGADFAGWLDQAVHAVTDRAGEVGRQMAVIRTAPQRALLLAAAVFEGTGPDIVHAAWRGLLKTVGHQEETTSELARTDFGERLTSLGIARDHEGRLRFERLAYADAVRTYFWANFPGLRDELRDWVAEASGLSGLTTDDRVDVVVRFGQRALAVGQPGHLFELAVRWADGAPGGGCDTRALVALELGLSHEKSGAWFRRQIYQVARSGSASDGLVRVLTAACLQSLGVTHPDQAVVRLHHLARRKGRAAQEAQQALLSLAGPDPRLYRLLVGRLLERSRREPHGVGPDLLLLTALLTIDHAPSPPPWPDLRRGWEAVFSRPPAEHWTTLVHGWLNAVAAGTAQESALRLMVQAAHGGRAALHRLYTIAFTWAAAADAPSREAVAALFWQHIDEARQARRMGPEHTDHAPHTGTGQRSTEETS